MKTLKIFYIMTTTLLLSTILPAQWVKTSGPPGRVGSLVVTGTNLFAGILDGGVFLSSNNGTNWIAVNTGMTFDSVISLSVSSTSLFAGTYGNGAYLSTNSGTSWTAINTGLSNDTITAFAISGTNTFAGTYGNGVFLSTNNGESWSAKSTGLTNPFIRSLAIIGTNIFAGTLGAGVFLSSNNGESWTEAGLANRVVYSFTVSDTNLFAGTDVGVFRSTDNGATWILGYNDLVWSLAISDTMLFIGTWDKGVFCSTVNSASWTAVNIGLTNLYVRSLAVSGFNLFAGTTDGVWTRPLSEMVTSVDKFSTDLPKQFKLDQNYPNPFNPATTIPFTLSLKSFVSLIVYDLIGREVATLVSEELPAGSYLRQWSATNISTGIYFYRLQTGISAETKKLILLR
jgi:hypothetical protein